MKIKIKNTGIGFGDLRDFEIAICSYKMECVYLEYYVRTRIRKMDHTYLEYFDTYKIPIYGDAKTSELLLCK